MLLRRPALRALLPVTALSLALAGCSGETPAPPRTDAPRTGMSALPTASVPATECPPEDGAQERRTTFDAPPPMCIDAAKTYTATMTTDAGDIVIRLDAKAAPQTVNNFVVLARYRYYDGIAFHRVIPGFMIQGGDPEGTGAGGPGYRFADELPDEGSYRVGSVAMANAGPGTNGSQFFIVTGAEGAQLPPDYSLFGTVTSGMDVVRKIEADGSPSGAPQTRHTITSVAIAEQ